MSRRFYGLLSLLSSSVSLALLISGWYLQQKVVAFLGIEIKQQYSLWSISHSFPYDGTVESYQSDSCRHEIISSGRSQRRHRHSSSSSSRRRRCVLGEKLFDEFDTLDTLSDLLLDLLSTNKSDVRTTNSQQRQREILTSRLSNIHFPNPNSRHISINRTYVGNSTIGGAGLGLFARRDIPKGTLLTCYPGDALVDLPKEGDFVKDLSGRGQITRGSHAMKFIGATHDESDGDYNDERVSKFINDSECDLRQEYMLRAVCDDWGIVAIPELFGNADPTYLGHFANDGVRYPPTRESELAAYVIESADMANAMHQPCEDCHMVTVSIRDLEAGEEIFVTYGPDYWREQSSFIQSVQNNDEDYDISYFEDFDDFDFDPEFNDDGEESIEVEKFSSLDDPSDSRGKGFG